eukprot:scaffold5312_cov71-Cyclotella_meneghiniana.AAC.1
MSGWPELAEQPPSKEHCCVFDSHQSKYNENQSDIVGHRPKNTVHSCSPSSALEYLLIAALIENSA